MVFQPNISLSGHLAMPEAELDRGKKEESMVWDKGGVPKGIPWKLR